MEHFSHLTQAPDQIRSLAMATKIEDQNKADEIDVDVHDVPVSAQEEVDPFEVDHAYLNASKFTRFFRGTLFQMIIFGWCVPQRHSGLQC